MGRAPCCDKANVKKGPWSPEEDDKLKSYIQKHGTAGNWIALPQKLGLRRCGKSCRLRWLNYLRPNIKHGEFSDDEDRIICSLFASIGSRWSIMAAQLPGRTDNDIKNYWNTKLKKKLMGINNNNIINYNIAPTLSTNYQNAPHQLINSPPPFHHLPEPYAAPADFSGSIGPGPTRFDSLIAFGGGAGDHHQDLLCNYFGSGVDEINDQKFSFGAAAASSTAEIEDPLEYSIEEIKQLIGTSNVCGGLMSFFADETVVKAEGI